MTSISDTLLSGPGAFGQFAVALRENDSAAMRVYPAPALAGLQRFVGKGQCNMCHIGPRFSNDEFADVAIPYFTQTGVDKGSYAGIKMLRVNLFTRLGQYSDNATSSGHR